MEKHLRYQTHRDATSTLIYCFCHFLFCFCFCFCARLQHENLNHQVPWSSCSMESKDLHYLEIVPENGIGVELLGRVEPKHVPHFTVSSTILVYICLYQIGFSSSIPQELKVQLISCWPCPILCTHLQTQMNPL